MTPVVMLHGNGWRIVRLQIPEKQREGPEDTGVRDWIEFADGLDLMGEVRWRQMDGKSAGVSDLVRVVNALKRELISRLEQS
jgi:hypothetical protein